MTMQPLASQKIFELLTETHQDKDQDMFFEINENEIFYLHNPESKEKTDPLKFNNEALLRRIIFYSNFSANNNKTVSFNIIDWERSSYENAKYETYEFYIKQERKLLKLKKFQESHPRNLALMQDAPILDYIGDVILVTEAEPIDNPGPRIIYANRAFEKMSGYSFCDLFGKTPRIFQGEQTSAADRKKIKEALKKWDAITIDIVNYTKSGSKFNVELDINPRMDEVGWYTHWVSVQRDISVRKEKQRQLEHNSKLALIGEIAAGVGHEINNPLAIIKGLLEITSLSLTELGLNDEKINLNFERMNKASERISKIAKGLRAFARVDTDKSDYFCVSEMIKETVDMLFDVYKKERVLIDFSSDQKKLIAFGNRGRFQQAITNLIANAKDATEGRESRSIIINSNIVESNISITIKDNGQGIPTEIRDKMFQPFFTTKELNKGTGIGLSLVRTIVQEHGGVVSFDSEVGKGTEFCISLPSANDNHEYLDIENKKDIKSVELKDKLQVLVVEDEYDLREIMNFHFSKIGLSVHLAENGKIAIEMIKSRTFDLIVSDISMPEMDGKMLFNAIGDLKIVNPPKFIFITGEVGSENEQMKDIINKVDGLLCKPLEIEEFSIKLNALFPSKFEKN